MLTPGAKVCPKCFTLVRPDVRNLLQPLVAPSVPTDWTYHTTNITIASSIKRVGLIPSFIRTGSDRAHPDGAFARNRDIRLALPATDKRNPVLQKLKEGVAYLTCLGMPEIAISQLNLVPHGIAFVPAGGVADAVNLRTQCDLALVALAEQAGCVKPPTDIKKVPNFIKVWSNIKISNLATQLAGLPAHCLTVWARQYVTLYYRIEELKTVHNVYFLKQRDSVDGYNSYTKGQSKVMIAVLRVRRAQIVGLVDDISEAMAECTPNVVLPAIIEIFVALSPDWFVNPLHRDNNANWINIRYWGV